MDRQQAKKDDRDNRRALRWGIGGALAVVVAVLIYNFASFGRGDPRAVSDGSALPAAASTAGSSGGGVKAP